MFKQFHFLNIIVRISFFVSQAFEAEIYFMSSFATYKNDWLDIALIITLLMELEKTQAQLCKVVITSPIQKFNSVALPPSFHIPCRENSFFLFSLFYFSNLFLSFRKTQNQLFTEGSGLFYCVVCMVFLYIHLLPASFNQSCVFLCVCVGKGKVYSCWQGTRCILDYSPVHQDVALNLFLGHS